VYSREEASRIRYEFWTTFGRYMSPVPSASGNKINWINYHTRVKDIYFRMDADSKAAMISISIEHRDRGIQQLYFEHLAQFKTLLQQELQEEWHWQLHTIVSDKVISRVFREFRGVSVFKKNDWPSLISFFKPRLVALDRFWEDARFSFDALS
jgi:hypothetical protein